MADGPLEGFDERLRRAAEIPSISFGNNSCSLTTAGPVLPLRKTGNASAGGSIGSGMGSFVWPDESDNVRLWKCSQLIASD